MKVAGAWCAFGLGSNLGDRFQLLQAAFDALTQVPGLKLLGCAPLYITEPLDCPEGSPAFLNTTAHGRYTGDVFALLDHTREIENQLGRRRTGKPNEARLIDIDLLMIEDVTLSTDRLTLPHPRLRDRLFVLRPLADLCPDLVLKGKHIDQIIGKLIDTGQTVENWDGLSLTLRSKECQ